MNRPLTLAIALVAFSSVIAAEPPPPATLSLPDQFDKTRDLKDLRGGVTILLYGDRQASDANRALGERLHIQFHPTAKGLAPAEARKAPVVPIAGLAEGAKSPPVHIVPVACMTKAPEVIVSLVKREVRKASPDLAVWMDAEGKMKETFGLKDGEPNLVILDAAGRLRYRAQGELDAKTYARVVEVVDFLRKEAVTPR